MLKKIIAIKNVGRFRNSAAPGNPQLAKYTLIGGANGFGKTTICAVLRSLQTGDSAHVLGRKTLGVADLPSVEILLDDGNARFDGTRWNTAIPGIAIFDGVFIAENVHSGDVVDLEHKRNLYRIIVGADAVRLAEEESELSAASRAKTGEVGAAIKTIRAVVPEGMNLETFIYLAEEIDIGDKIEVQERSVAALRQAARLRTQSGLLEFAFPTFPEELGALLSRTIDDISQDAEERLSAHLAAHGLEGRSDWIADGLVITADTCPFCGQDVRSLPLIAAFRAVFSERYMALTSQISQMKAELSQDFGEAVLARLELIVEQNIRSTEFWQQYCALNVETLSVPPEVLESICPVVIEATQLLDRKAVAPLEPISESESFVSARLAYGRAAAIVTSTNIAIRSANAIIAEKKVVSGSGDVDVANSELTRLRAIQTRHRADIAKLCLDYLQLCKEKEAIEAHKEAVRARLDAHTKNVIGPYERRINDYLSAFNAGFHITETKHAYPAGAASSTYQLVINDTTVDIGDGRTPVDRASFKNTLSAGDRTTLALAFFLAHLDQDAAIAGKLVVFDDPFSSQDSFRRRQTVHEIMKVAGKCAQVIVLSHDATFLKQVWDKCPAAERIALTIADHRSNGSKIMVLDLEQACKGRTAIDIDDLQAYLATGAGSLIDIIRKMRVVLESYCRTTYSESFDAGEWLGDMVRKVREGGMLHPAHSLYDELDQINAYTSQYHHGENAADITSDQIDPTELTGFARRTLRVINALQA